ncbi:hypothetical protein EJB05_53758, partial [Eragrostis curvula]
MPIASILISWRSASIDPRIDGDDARSEGGIGPVHHDAVLFRSAKATHRIANRRLFTPIVCAVALAGAAPPPPRYTPGNVAHLQPKVASAFPPPCFNAVCFTKGLSCTGSNSGSSHSLGEERAGQRVGAAQAARGVTGPESHFSDGCIFAYYLHIFLAFLSEPVPRFYFVADAVVVLLILRYDNSSGLLQVIRVWGLLIRLMQSDGIVHGYD